MTESELPEARPTVIMTLLILVGTVVFMLGYFGLHTILGVGTAYIGLLFLLYWAAILHMDFESYASSIIGGIAGLSLAWMLTALPKTLGQSGTIIAYSALAVVLFCFTRGQAALLANHCALLFVLVASIPELDVTHNLASMIGSLLIAAAYIGALAGSFRVIKLRRGVR